MSLPRKNENNNLSSNYDVAKRRFDQLIKKFQNDVPLFDQHREVIQDYVVAAVCIQLYQGELKTQFIMVNVAYYRVLGCKRQL